MCRVSDSCKLFSGIYHAVGDRTDAAGGSLRRYHWHGARTPWRAAGLRTHVLVSLGAAISAIVGLYTTEVLEYSNDPLRVGAQVISRIGFLGVGSILIVGKSHVRGLTTAAGLWATASIGLASGVGYLTVACAATLVVFLTMTVMSRLEASARFEANNERYYIELSDINMVNGLVEELQPQLRGGGCQRHRGAQQDDWSHWAGDRGRRWPPSINRERM